MITVASYGIFALLLFAGALVQKQLPRQLLLLGASYVFYGSWGTWFLAILVISSLFNYSYGLFLQRNPTVHRLWGGVIGNVLLLGFFKYVHLAAEVAGPNSAVAEFLSGIAMPLGISFWTFQGLSYLFDVYRQEELDPSPIEFCLYMAFWPTVIMGPICRLGNLLPQFRESRTTSATDLLAGLQRIGTGLFMKLVVSQVLVSGITPGTGVAAGFDRNLSAYGGLDVWFLAVGFGLQLFFDFAGYSHIVIGAARVFGFRLDENFNSPFLASSPSEFWTRWHMSLSSWIRDYVFMPVAAARREVWWRYGALLFSMTLFGLWHGAKSTFVLWGFYQGVLLVLHRVIQQFRRNSASEMPVVWSTPVSWAVTFLAISLGWIFFRANSVSQVLTMLGSIVDPRTYTQPGLPANYYLLISGVLLGYLAYEIGGSFIRERIALRDMFSNWETGTFARYGFTREFLTVVSLIPVAFILFFAMLLVHSGSDGVSPFVYTVF